MRGWTEEELAARLARIGDPIGRVRFERMTPAQGWDLIGSRSLLASGAKGRPSPDGPFARAWRALERFELSDPRIVVAHFEPDAPLLGRRLLHEIRVLGLRYLCPARIGEVRSVSNEERTELGLRIDTLPGHIERGAEWLVLSQDHRTGEIHLDIHAAFTPGDFPNGWSRAGFRVLARPYQRAWHRLAHLRLAELLRGATPARGRVWPAALGLGALSGMRSMAGPLFFARAASSSGLAGLLASRRVARALGVLAAAELVADKWPRIPARIEPGPLTGRVLAGALSGASIASARGRRRLVPALLGGGAALASAAGAYLVRKRLGRRLGVPDALLGLAEDALVLASGAALGRALRRGARPVS